MGSSSGGFIAVYEYLGTRWTVDDIKNLLRDLATTVARKLDDHDVLVELRTTQGLMLTQVETMVKQLHDTARDHERRIRLLERTMFYGLGALGLALVLFKALGGHF